MNRARLLLLIGVAAFLIQPAPAWAHALNGTLTGRYTPKVERYRPMVKKWLKHFRVYTKAREGRVLNIILHESGGRPSARNGQHVGLVQFTRSWKHDYSRAHFRRYKIGDWHKDNRLSADWSIRRLAKVYKVGGTSKVIQHWRATYYR